MANHNGRLGQAQPLCPTNNKYVGKREIWQTFLKKQQKTFKIKPQCDEHLVIQNWQFVRLLTLSTNNKNKEIKSTGQVFHNMGSKSVLKNFFHPPGSDFL